MIKKQIAYTCDRCKTTLVLQGDVIGTYEEWPKGWSDTVMTTEAHGEEWYCLCQACTNHVQHALKYYDPQ